MPDKRHNQLLCTAMAELKFSEFPLATCVAPYSGNACLWGLGARAYCRFPLTAPLVLALGPAKISVLFWLDNILALQTSAISMAASNKDRCCASSSRAPSSPNSPSKSPKFHALRHTPERAEAPFAHYSAALIAPDDALACHLSAIHPKRRPTRRLSSGQP